MPSLSDFGQTTQYNRRTAEANKQQQNAKYQAQLALNQSTGQTVGSGQQMAAPVPTNQNLANAQNVYQNAANGYQSSMTQSMQDGQRVQGGVQTAGNGVIEQSAIDRLRASGMNDAQIQQQLASQKPVIQQTMSNTGLSAADQIKAAGDAAEARLRASNNLDPTQLQQARAQAEANAMEQIRIQDGQKQQAKQKEGQNAAGAQMSQMAPQDAGAQALFANLPPEAQALAPFLQNMLSTIEQGQQDQAKTAQTLLDGGEMDINGQKVQVQGVNKTFDAVDQRIKDMENGYLSMQKGIEGMLQQARDTQQAAIDEQEKAAKERLAWQETELLRRADKQKAQAVDSKIAELALKNRMGGDGGLREVAEVRSEFESRMDDIRIEFGIQRTDLAAKFTAMHAEATNNYVTQSIANIKDTASALERIAGQSMASMQARGKAEQDVLTKFSEQTIAGRKEYAGAILGFAKEMSSMILAEKRFQQQDAAAEERMRFQEQMQNQRLSFQEQQADKRFSMQLDREDAKEDKYARTERRRTLTEGRTNMEQLNSYKTLQQTDLRYLNAESLYQQWKKDPKNTNTRALLGDALQYGMSKFNDSNSAVMIGEYRRYVDAQGGVETMKQKVDNWIKGGGSLTDGMIDAMMSAVSTGQAAAKAQLYKDMLPIVNSINTFNSTYPGYDADLLDIVPADYLPFTDDLQGTADDLWDPKPTTPVVVGGGAASVGEAYASLGRITQDFNTTIGTDIYDEGTVKAWGGKHLGLDIALPEGSEIPSFVSGTVVSYGKEGGWGNTVVIEDDRGGQHRLSHLGKFTGWLKKGERVNSGEVIALSGNTGRSTGPHLDYRIKYKGKYVDPFSYHS